VPPTETTIGSEQAHQIFQAAQQASISVFVSSGDFGADNNLSFTTTSYPASTDLGELGSRTRHKSRD